MKKIFILSLSILSIFILVLAIILNKYKDNNYEKEKIIAVKTNYFYQTNECFPIILYSNSKSSFLTYYEDYDLYLANSLGESLRPTIDDVTLNSSVIYQNEFYYEYYIYLKIKGNNLNLNDANISIIYSNVTFKIEIGNITYYDYNDLKEFSNFTTLCGISENNKYLNIKAIYLEINNQKNIDLKLANPSVINYNLKMIEVDEYIDSDINSYSITEKNLKNTITIKPNQNLKLLLIFEEKQETLLTTFPIFLNVNGIDAYILRFNYLKISELDMVEEIITEGVYDGV